jgi:hypothetical protein
MLRQPQPARLGRQAKAEELAKLARVNCSCLTFECQLCVFGEQALSTAEPSSQSPMGRMIYPENLMRFLELAAAYAALAVAGRAGYPLGPQLLDSRR